MVKLYCYAFAHITTICMQVAVVAVATCVHGLKTMQTIGIGCK